MPGVPSFLPLPKPARHATNEYQQPLAFSSVGHIYIMVPFPVALGGSRFLLVFVDYFTKCIEAEPLSMVTTKKRIKFMWKNILTRFSTSRVQISDNDTQFEGSPFKERCEENQIHHQFTSAAHPHAKGQAEVSKKIIVNSLNKCMMKSKVAWVEELSIILWSYRTTSSSSTRETPFSLTYGTKAVLPLEILRRSLWVTGLDANTNEAEQHQDLDVLDEKREAAQLRQAAYKARTENYYNMCVRVKNFKVGEWVLRKNKSSHAQPQGKIRVVWKDRTKF